MYRKEKNAEDVLYILKHLRPEDKHEAIIHSGEKYIDKCLKEIMECKGDYVMGCKKSDDTPVCIGGCEPTEDKEIGIVWLLSTPEIANHQMIILKNIKYELTKYQSRYWMLCNIIYQENFLAKKWLSKFGFKFDNIIEAKLPEGFEFFYKNML